MNRHTHEQIQLKVLRPQARKDFIAAVTARANLLGLSDKASTLEVALAQTQGDVTVIAGQAWPAKVSGQRDKLVECQPKLSHFEDDLQPNLSHPNRLFCLFLKQGWARSDQRGNFEQMTQTCPSRQGLHPAS